MKSAKKADLVVEPRPTGSQLNGLYFRWEAKIVRNTSASRRAYYEDGMYRHIRGDYSGQVDDGGMLGYVIDGTATAEMATKLCEYLGKKRKPPPDPPPVPEAEHPVWETGPSGQIRCDDGLVKGTSTHPRVGQGAIRLHHYLIELQVSNGGH